MTTPPLPPNDPREPGNAPDLETLLDQRSAGELSQADAIALDALLRADPALQRAASEFAMLDQELRRAFAPPAAPALAAALQGAPIAEVAASFAHRASTITGADADRAPPTLSIHGASPGATRISRASWALLAASVFLMIGGAWWLSAPPTRRLTRVAPDQVYQRIVDTGFQPRFVCTTDEEFARTVRTRFGQPLLIGAAPEISLLGWDYSSPYEGITLGKRALILLARVSGRPVLLFMDRVSEDRRLKVDPSRGLTLHRAVVGGVVLYELTPLGAPVLLKHAYNPDAGVPAPEP